MDNNSTTPAKFEKPIQVKEGNFVNQSLASREPFGGRKEIVILHDGEEYRLRITRNNKLILTK